MQDLVQYSQFSFIYTCQLHNSLVNMDQDDEIKLYYYYLAHYR